MAILIWEIDMGIGQFAFYILTSFYILFRKECLLVLRVGKIIVVGHFSRLASLAGMIYLASSSTLLQISHTERQNDQHPTTTRFSFIWQAMAAEDGTDNLSNIPS